MNHRYSLAGSLVRLSLLFGSVVVASTWGTVPGIISLTVALGAFSS